MRVSLLLKVEDKNTRQLTQKSTPIYIKILAKEYSRTEMTQVPYPT